jgi:DNA-damage-inducible protein J
MPGTATISVRTDISTKQKAEGILQKLGIKPTDAVNLFYRQVILNRGLPFEVSLPNDETLAALRDIEEGRNLVKCKNAKDMFDRLGI